jgi:hypothetical protein
MGPALRPLDFAALVQSPDAMHAELARTVDELAQWLSVVEVGLTQMLDGACEDTIEEEQEWQDDGPPLMPQVNGVSVDGHELYHEEVAPP